ncbi:hypothetical protein Asp14428_66730 [Actinoplanes sp. NBRC 14428]|nr:hypothetical protein Asp14428_66730 [Actinoplanes sp. NBRC 14428]
MVKKIRGLAAAAVMLSSIPVLAVTLGAPTADGVRVRPRKRHLAAAARHAAEARAVGVAAVHGKLHLIGGRDSHTVEPIPGTPISQGFGTVRTHLVYDPARHRWSEAAPLPADPRDHAGIAVLGHSIHVFGGRATTETTNLARHDVYDTRTGRWSTAAPLPTPRSAGAAVVLGGRIVYAGGECKGDAATTPPASTTT